MTPRLPALAALVFAALAGCREDALPPAPEALLVRTAPATRSAYAPAISFTGEIVARDQSVLSFRSSGQVTEMLADTGDHVTEGQVLARLDSSQQRADVASARAAVQAAQALVRQAASAFARQQELLANGFTTRRDHDAAQQALRVAEAAAESAGAQLTTAEATLGYAELRAGAAGSIVERNVDAGELVQAAQSVFVLAEDGPRDAIFDINESLLLGQAAAPAVTIALVSRPEVSAPGVVRQVSPTVDVTTGTVRVKVGIAAVPEGMTLGSAVTGSGSPQAEQVFVLPWTALSTLDGEPAVFVVDDANRVSLRAVTVLAHRTGDVVISDGLTEGEQVVIQGTKLLRPGQLVSIAAAEVSQ